jgi:ParB family chromosome partitioning protein
MRWTKEEGNSVTSIGRRRSKQLRDIVSEKPDDGSTPKQPLARSSGAVAAMGRALDSLTANEADNWPRGPMHENVQELDAGLFTPSTVSDRIPTADDAEYQALKAAIRDNGQMIPIIARPHPGAEGQFQIAAGHRRWRVAQEIGRPLKAIIRMLTDQEMVILQGQENGARADLSFIERARFALEMEALGHTRDTLAAALNVDKPEVSRLLTVAQAVGETLMLAIGPAPKVGRPRWLALAKALDTPEARKRLDAVLPSHQFQNAPTDRRFSIVLQALEDQKTSGIPQGGSSDRLAWVEKKGGKTRVILEDPDFAAYLESRLPWLFKEFGRRRG